MYEMKIYTKNVYFCLKNAVKNWSFSVVILLYKERIFFCSIFFDVTLHIKQNQNIVNLYDLYNFHFA